MKNLILLLHFIFLSLLCFAQEQKLIKKADNLFEEKNYSSAIKLYQQALEGNNKDPYINFQIAKCYLSYTGRAKALQYAYDAVQNSPNPSLAMYYALAQSYQLNHQFDKASEYYKKSDPANKNKKLIVKYLAECENGKKYMNNPVNVKISNAGELINSEHQEYLPNITADLSKLFFTSRRPGSTGGKKDTDGKYFEDVYISSNKGGVWEAPLNASAPINSDIHDACIGISEDGQTMFLYKGSNGGDIYTSELKGDKWTKPVPVPVNTEFFESTASLSSDGRTLFFVRSVMQGNRDIYICSRTIDGAWSKPKKMEVVNTEFDEDSPYMHPDGKTLFFSSKGHSTMGGYDIFKIVKTATGWSSPENLGYPINTAGDDVYFSLSADGKIGLYSSEKEGGFGLQDIYSIRMPVSEKSPALALLKGTVKDETGKAQEASITITDNMSKEIIAKFNSNSTSGEYLIALPSGKNYGISVDKPGYLFYSENVFLSSDEGYKEVKKEIKLLYTKSGARVVMKNIFFDSGKSELQPESISELFRLVKFLNENQSLKIEISGHTDNIGDGEANLALSQKRAEEVGKVLIGNGISSERLILKGYGSSKPIESNEMEEGRKMNRRTEIKIL